MQAPARTPRNSLTTIGTKPLSELLSDAFARVNQRVDEPVPEGCFTIELAAAEWGVVEDTARGRIMKMLRAGIVTDAGTIRRGRHMLRVFRFA